MADRMILFSIEEFAARRRVAQTALEKDLHDAVVLALDTQTDTSGWGDLLDLVTRLYRTTYYLESGARTPGMPRGFRGELLDTLRKTKGRDDATVARIEVWLATAILSQVSIQASLDDPEELFLEWVTMEDTDVRDTHRAADHQVQPIGDKYDVGGEHMRYPGDPTVSIALWINCRCALRPVLASEANTAGGTVTTYNTTTGAHPFVKSTITWAPKKKKPVDDPADPNEDPNDPNEDTESPAEEDAEDAPETDPKKKKKGMKAPFAWHGVLAPEGIPSGDGRMFAPDSLTNRDLPLPLTWQKASSDGHAGSVTVAKIEKIERLDGMMRASGHFIDNPEAVEVMGLLEEFGKFGVSVDADDAVMEIDDANEMVVFTAARIASASIVAIPAFAEAFVSLGPWDDADITEPVDEAVPEPVAVSALAAAVGHAAPAAWFTNPGLTRLTPLTVTDEGRVFGHLAGWETCHIGFMDTCTAPPPSMTQYAYFLTGQVALDNGERAEVGPLTIGGGHASPNAGLRAAVAHYDSTSTVVADVTMGEDDHGIWFAGWVRPGVTDEMVTALRASALSGDWRKVGNNLELVAALAVNTPGFPVPRTRVAASAMGQLSLVASGVVSAPETTDFNRLNPEQFADAVVTALAARDARKARMLALASRVNGVPDGV